MEQKDLSEIRKEILEIDKQMAALFEQRMKLAAGVIDIKKELGLPVTDPEREKIVLLNENGSKNRQKHLYRIYTKNDRIDKKD